MSNNVTGSIDSRRQGQVPQVQKIIKMILPHLAEHPHVDMIYKVSKLSSLYCSEKRSLRNSGSSDLHLPGHFLVNSAETLKSHRIAVRPGIHRCYRDQLTTKTSKHGSSWESDSAIWSVATQFHMKVV